VKSETTGLMKPVDPTVIRLMAEGKSDKQIAAELGFTFNQIRWHVQEAHRKMGTSKRVLLVNKFMDGDLVEGAQTPGT